MTRTEITDGVAELLEEIAGVRPADIADDKTLRRDLDVDSLSMVEVIVAVEEKFGIRIPDEDVHSFATFGDLVDRIENDTRAVKA